ncbi:cytochrome c [Sinorhizobium sp. BG8]|uniref:c-type cytochrome n=1 Tax=Sinorhizobium sp. BG8 TaxID=2613773 RepID=UPI00193DD26F|nr:cytochrome c [Sinorhizobium sp. BG8]QRM54667.1 cytochrome C556 [Sinorhizobium sp. BG8]
MNVKTIAAAAAFAVAAVTIASAADEPQAVRQQMMKGVGQAMGALVAITKGEKPYDAEVVKASLTTFSKAGKAFPDLFPVGSETGAETEASPKIWQSMDDFKAKSLKFSADADAVLAAMPADQAGVAAAVKTLGANCSGCHEAYRIKK